MESPDGNKPLIIDMHVHLFPNLEVGKMIVEQFEQTYNVGYHSFGTPDEYLADMQRAGIDYGVVVSFAPDNQIKNNNFWTVAITRPKKTKPAAYPMLIPYVSVSPTMKGRSLIEELDARLAWGMRGLKIHPIAQNFAPDDSRLWPVYAWMVEHDLPVTAHAGINVRPDQKTDLARPCRWEAVLRDFPTLRLTLAHMGGGYWEETIRLCRQYPQITLDTAIALRAGHYDEPNWLDDNEAVEMINAVGAERVMFGSDYPWIDPKPDIERIRSLPLSEREIQQILGENARRWLGIK